MAEAAAATSSTTKSPKKKTTAKVTKVAAHPPTATMVNEALKSLKDRKGSSLQAIKNYIGATYKLDVAKYAPFIRKYIASAAESGKLIQTKGQGASGSFKLPPTTEKKQVAKKVSKPKTEEKKSKPAKKKAPKKPAEKKVKPSKSPKAKKVAKPPTKKPKAPKPKSVAKKSPKKAAAKKK